MSKNNHNGTGVSLSILCRVAKNYLGVAGGKNVSPYSLVAKVLLSNGRVPKDKQSERAFVRENRDEVIRLYVAINTTAKVATKPTTKPRIAPANRPLSMTYDQANCDEFLSSYQWRQLRMVAIKKHGARCQCCGASAATGAVIHVDHIKPRRLFPELALDLENLQILCHDCNHGKGNWDQTDWRNKS